MKSPETGVIPARIIFAKDLGVNLPLSPLTILKVVAKQYETSQDEIRSASRKKGLVHARHMAMYLMVKFSGRSLTEIGPIVGRASHTSVLRGHNKIASLIQAMDIDIASEVQDLMGRIKNLPFA